MGDRSCHRADGRGAFAISRSQIARKTLGWRIRAPVHFASILACRQWVTEAATELTAEVLLPLAEARMLAKHKNTRDGNPPRWLAKGLLRLAEARGDLAARQEADGRGAFSAILQAW